MSTPKFYDRAIDTGEHGTDGKPVYRMATYFLMQMDANNTVDREVRDADKERFPNEYDIYEKTRQPDAEGFPLAAWIGVDAAERQGLADRGIFTVEKLAATNMTKAPAELRDAQEKAKAFLEKTSSEGPKLAARIAELEDDKSALLEQIEDMKSAIDDLKAESEAPKLEKRIVELDALLTVAGEESGKQAAALAERDAKIEALGKELAAAKAAKK